MRPRFGPKIKFVARTRRPVHQDLKQAGQGPDGGFSMALWEGDEARSVDDDRLVLCRSGRRRPPHTVAFAVTGETSLGPGPGEADHTREAVRERRVSLAGPIRRPEYCLGADIFPQAPGTSTTRIQDTGDVGAVSEKTGACGHGAHDGVEVATPKSEVESESAVSVSVSKSGNSGELDQVRMPLRR